jgi:CRP-like cAMP-binding protein
VEARLGEVLSALRPQERPEREADEKETIFRVLYHSDLLRHQEGEKAGEPLASEDEIRVMAGLAAKKRYAPGEVIFRQGEPGETCYIVSSGLVRGEILYEEKGKTYSSEFRVGPGGIFGEMSLFTGMPRTATGIVEAESELLEIGAGAFGAILASNPKLSELIAEVVSARNQKNQEFLSKIKELSEKELKDSTNKKTILERLRRFVRMFKKL